MIRPLVAYAVVLVVAFSVMALAFGHPVADLTHHLQGLAQTGGQR